MTATSNTLTTEPNDQEIVSWWTWASKFTKGIDSPFDLGWKGADRNDAGQIYNVFCLSCTAGAVGPDNETRPLDTARKSGKDILVPVIVACADTLDDAKAILGEPSVQFLVNGQEQDSFYKETFIKSIDFVPNNSFDEVPGNKSIYSVGYWAKVSSVGLESLQFGGTGGMVSLVQNSEFQTLVTYQ